MSEKKVMKGAATATTTAGTDLTFTQIAEYQADSASARRTPVTSTLVLALVASLLGSCLPSGYCLGVINTPQEILRSWVRAVVDEQYEIQLTQTGEMTLWALVVSLFICGAVLGSTVGGRLADSMGRRPALLLNHMFYIVAAFLFMFSKHMSSVGMLLAGRFTSGLCTGLANCMVPLYLSEVAPEELRGVMGVLFPLGLCTGILIAQILGLDSILGTESAWPYLLGGFVVCVFVAVLLHPAIPESPTFCYLMVRDEAQGLKELQRLRGKDSKAAVAEESALQALAKVVSEDEGNSAPSIREVIRSRTYRMPLMISILSNAGQQFSGVNAVFFYSTLIFRSAGMDLRQSQGVSIGAGAINCLMSLLAVPLIKSCQRRVLLLSSLVPCVACLCMLMGSLWLLPTWPSAAYVAIVALMLYVVAYGLGLGPVPFMLATELFPVGPRSVGLAAGSTANWVSNLVVSLVFPLIQGVWGEFSFLLFITISCFFGAFIYKFLPETLGATPPLTPSHSGEKETTEEQHCAGRDTSPVMV